MSFSFRNIIGFDSIIFKEIDCLLMEVESFELKEVKKYSIEFKGISFIQYYADESINEFNIIDVYFSLYKNADFIKDLKYSREDVENHFALKLDGLSHHLILVFKNYKISPAEKDEI